MELSQAFHESLNCAARIYHCCQEQDVLVFDHFDRVLRTLVLPRLHGHDFVDPLHEVRIGPHVCLFDVICLKLSAHAALSQFLLQISIELQRVVLSHHDAQFLIIDFEVAEDALCHALKSALDHPVWHHDALYERFEPARDIEVAKFKVEISSH